MHPAPATTTVTAPRNPWPGMIAVVGAVIAAMTPAFTISTLALPIGRELHLGGTMLGLVLSGFYLCTAAGALPARRFADRLPVPAALGITSAAATTGLLLTTTGTVGLVVGLLLAGTGGALTQPVAARYIAARIPDRRLSLATGLTGVALGAAPLVPGLLAALVAPPYGWRTAVATAAALPLLTATTVRLASLAPALTTAAPATSSADTRSALPVARPRQRISRVLALWALAAGLATIGSGGSASFLVQFGVDSGLSANLAASMLSASSVLAIVVRLVAGLRADRAPRYNPHVVAAMMASGALGLMLIALRLPVTFVVGATLAVAGGWGWTGLLLAAALRALPGQATRAGATVQLGLFGGSALAPIAVGSLSATYGVPTAVLVAAAAALLATLAIETGNHLLPKETST